MIYIILLILLLLLSYEYDFLRHSLFMKHWVCIVLLLFIVVAGFRYRLGGDTINYMEWFENVSSFSDWSIDLQDYELGFVFIAVFVKSVGGDFYLLQIIVASIFNIAIFLFFYRNSRSSFFMCLLLYFFLYYYFLCFEVMRESLAVALFLYSSTYLSRSKYIQYYSICFVALLFHYSSLFLLLLPLCRGLKLNRNVICLIFLLLICYTYLNQLFKELIVLFALNPRLSHIVEVYTTVEVYSEAGALNLKGYISQCFVPIMALLFPLWYYKKYINSAHRYEFLIVTMAFTQASIIGIPIFYRFTNYLFPFSLICMSEVLFFLMFRIKQNVNRFFCIVTLILIPYFFFYFMAVYNYKMYGKYHKYYMFYPYHSIFNERTCKEREYIYSIGL